MKANIWQILGLILIIAGVVMFVRKKTGPNDTTAAPSNHTAPAAATAPTTHP
jgi:hypothetical protein